MKNIDRLIEVADLDAIAYCNDAFVLFIDTEDDNVPTTLCVEANFDSLQFGPIQPLSEYLKLKHYLPLLDVDARISQRQRILDEIDPATIAAMLQDFNYKKRLIQEKIVPISEMYPGWQPGG